jgi:hypothetical protein
MTRTVPGPSKMRTAKTMSPKRDGVSKSKTEDAKMTDPKLTMEVPAQIKEFAEKGIQQAEKA